MSDAFRIQSAGNTLVTVLFVGGLLLFVNILLHRYGPALSARWRRRRVYNQLIPVVEAASWLWYTAWLMDGLLPDPLDRWVPGLLLAGVSAWLFWFFVRDWVAGVILKTQNGWERGQHISSPDVNGLISRIGLLSLEVEDETGSMLRVPYSRIIRGTHGKARPDLSASQHRFNISVIKPVAVHDIISRLRLAVYNSPWSSPHTEPRIRLLEEHQDVCIFEVVITAASARYTRLIQQHVTEVIRNESGEADTGT